MMMELRIVVWPGGQEKLQCRFIETWEGNDNITLPMKPVWGQWSDVPRVDYRAAVSSAAPDQPKGSE